MTGIILGFDFGTKRIGIAVGQSLAQTSRPLTQITSVDWDALDKIVAEWQPEALVVGLPLNMDETESKLSRAARQFGRSLINRYKKPVHHIDERLSTREARERLSDRGITSPDKARLNSVAAQIILETWFSISAP